MNKSEIRLYIKNLVKENINSLQSESQILCNKIIESEVYKNSQIILGYMALPDEVQIDFVLKNAIAQKKTVYLPHVFPNTNKMDFFKFDSLFKTTTGEFGISEPLINSNTPVFNSTTLSPDEKVLVLVPGRAFTADGDRLGRGKGFYDIYFEKITEKNVTLAGVCFSFQILPAIPVTNSDRKMDCVFYF